MGTKAWRCMLRKRRGTGEVMTNAVLIRSGAGLQNDTRDAISARGTVGNASRGGFMANCGESLPEFPRSAPLNEGSRKTEPPLGILSDPASYSYEAGTAKSYNWRFARETCFEGCLSWNLKPKSGLIAVDPISVDRKLRDAKAHLPRGFLKRRRRVSGRGERLSGVIDHGGHGGRCATFRYFARILHFPLANSASP